MDFSGIIFINFVKICENVNILFVQKNIALFFGIFTDFYIRKFTIDKFINDFIKLNLNCLKGKSTNLNHKPLKLAFLFSTNDDIPYFEAFVASIG